MEHAVSSADGPERTLVRLEDRPSMDDDCMYFNYTISGTLPREALSIISFHEMPTGRIYGV